MTAAKNIFNIAFNRPVLIVMCGNEKLKIPMTGDFESLNVSIIQV